MSDIDDSIIQQFCGITGLSADRARFYVEAANGDLDVAVGQYFENQGDDDDDEYFPAQEAEERRPQATRLPEPVVQKIEPKKPETQKPSSSNKKLFTLSDLSGGGGGEDDEGNSSGEEGQAFYAGGSETSGQQILGPPRQRDPNKLIKDMFQKVISLRK
jgi:UBX domain-containing protein 1